ncbi:MAG: amphi-Trp domain-containing protein [Candidatus Hydrogenedentes bacterium]|nr:amphi-Trp domain-containing protein [Candidatus Hydrogenedentota bacterium]
MSDKSERDIEKVYSTADYVAKLRRLADALESGDKFEIQIAGERIYVPVRAEFSIEHERGEDEEEIEFQIRWKREV